MTTTREEAITEVRAHLADGNRWISNETCNFLIRALSTWLDPEDVEKEIESRIGHDDSVRLLSSDDIERVDNVHLGLRIAAAIVREMKR